VKSPGGNTDRADAETCIARATGWFKRIEEAKLEPDLGSYNAVLASCAEAGDRDAASRWLNDISAAALQPDIRSYTIAIAACAGTIGSGDALQKAFDLFSEMGQAGINPDIDAYNALLKCYAKKDKTKDAVDWMLESMRHDSVAPDGFSYAALMQCRVANGDVDGAIACLGDMTDFSVRPDRFCWNLCIDACTQVGRMRDAEKLLERLRQDGEKPDETTFASLITGFAKNGLKEEAIATIDKMEAEPLQPSAVHFAAAMHACSNARDLAGAESLLDRMETAQVAPDIVVLNELVHASVASGRLDRAMEMFARIREFGLVPSVVTMNILISSHAKSGDIEGAEKLLGVMRNEGLEPDVRTYTAVIDGCAQKGLLRQAEEWLAKMIEAGCVPNSHTLTVLVKAYADFGDLERAGVWLDYMIRANIARSVVTYTPLVTRSAVARHAPDRLTQYWFDRMLDDGVEPDTTAYNALLRANGRTGGRKKAMDLLSAMRERGCEPDLFSWTFVIEAFKTHRASAQDIRQLLRQMVTRDGVVPDDKMLQTLRKTLGEGVVKELCAELNIPDSVAGQRYKTPAQLRRKARRAAERARAAALSQKNPPDV